MNNRQKVCPPIRVGRKNSSYFIHFADSATWIPKLADLAQKKRQIFLCVDEKIAKLYAKQILQLKRRLPVQGILALPAGERGKAFNQLERTLNFLLTSRIERGALLIAIGGGATSDVVGFAAGICLRGVSWGVVPTTLLGMIDAAIGGKTGVNMSQGKNLVGVIWPPSFVLVNSSFMITQKPAEIAGGLGEALKYHIISGSPSLAKIKHVIDMSERPEEVSQSLLCDCIRVKARIVTKDEREFHQRLFLNFGHTIGHAIERAMNYRGITHGRAVAAGSVGALFLSERLGGASGRGIAAAREAALQLAGYGTSILVDLSGVIAHVSSDKKRRDGHTRFVLVKEIGHPTINDTIPPTLLRQAVKVSIAALSGH